MQVVHIVINGQIEVVTLPGREAEILPGVFWGDTDDPLTPAWWARRACWASLNGAYAGHIAPLARSLAEDLVFCLLGGHGIRAEIACAAFAVLRNEGLFHKQLDPKGIESILRIPLEIRG